MVLLFSLCCKFYFMFNWFYFLLDRPFFPCAQKNFAKKKKRKRKEKTKVRPERSLSLLKSATPSRKRCAVCMHPDPFF